MSPRIIKPKPNLDPNPEATILCRNCNSFIEYGPNDVKELRVNDPTDLSILGRQKQRQHSEFFIDCPKCGQQVIIPFLWW